MIPTLKTKRLLLNAFTEKDIPAVVKLAGDKEVAKTTLSMPHPYHRAHAETWIATHALHFVEGRGVTFAVRLKSGKLMGTISLSLEKHHHRCELGYWIGRPFWNKGYCTEAARAVIGYAFKTLKLNKVYARHLAHNPPSGRVMEKCGMTKEGYQRQQFKRWGKFADVVEYGLLRRDNGV